MLTWQEADDSIMSGKQVSLPVTMKGKWIMTRQEVMAREGFVITWDTKELQESFEVLGFCMGFCGIKCRKTGKLGSIDFERFYIDDKPVRLYHTLVWDSK